MLPLTRSRGRQRFFGGGWNPFSQLGPTLDLTFAGVPTDPLGVSSLTDYTLNTDFIIPQYQIAAQYVVWETGVGLVDKTFSQIITFTRASTGTYFDSAGVLQSAAVDAPRLDYNPSTLAAQGLLIEEARTNLITSSAALPAGVNVTITADTFVAPDGTTTGDQILDNATLGEHYSDSSFTPVAATNYTFSAFIKNIGASSSGFAVLRLAGDFSAFVIVNLSTFTVATTGGAQYVSSSVQAINNGWYKVSVTGVSVSTVASVARIQVTDAANLAPYSGTGEGFAVWGRQLEAGAFPTSYIPTTTTALTRSADVASVNTLSPWYNSVSGTLFVEAQVAAGIGAAPAVMAGLDDTTINNRLQLRRQSPGIFGDGRFVSSGGNWTGTVTSGTLTSVNKQAVAYASSDQAGAVNGTLMTGIVSVATLPTITRLALGDGQGSTPLNGWLRRVSYFPRRLANAELQSLTS